MSRWVEVCAADDVPFLEGRRVVVRGFHIAVFNTEGGFFAVGDVCPHRGGPLSDGDVAAATVSCPLHARKVDLRSGCVTNDDRSRVLTLPARVRDGKVILDVASLPPLEAPAEDDEAVA